MDARLVAREPEQVSGVMEELVDVVAPDKGGRTLLCSDEVEQEHRDEQAKGRPRSPLAKRDPNWDREH